MRLRDHRDLLIRIYKESDIPGWLAIFSAITMMWSPFYKFILPKEIQDTIKSLGEAVAENWMVALVFFLSTIIYILYQRLTPKVEVKYLENDAFYRRRNGSREIIAVELYNYGEWQDNISFRLDRIDTEGGENVWAERRGFVREDARTPTMPLSPESPKTAFVASFDEAEGDCIRFETCSPIHSDGSYAFEPIKLRLGQYIAHVSLNPRKGRPCKRRLKIWYERGAGLRMREV